MESETTDSTGGVVAVTVDQAALAEWLPPKRPAELKPSHLLPPRSNSGFTKLVGHNDLAEAGIRLPTADGGYETVEERVAYIEFDGEQIPVPLPDRRMRWRLRAIFNFIAMLICLGILYLAFLLFFP